MFKPHLAGEAVLGKLNYGPGGLVALPKLNGVRGINQEGRLYARSLKRLANEFTNLLFDQPAFSNLDGELVVGQFNHEDVFTITSGALRSISGAPDVCWYVFDLYHPTAPYLTRLRMRDKVLASGGFSHPERVKAIPWRIVKSDAELEAYSEEVVADGYEGLVLRDPSAQYKQGRSTDAEQSFLRYCGWLRSEAIILEIHEGTVNNNESVVNELGYKRKATVKANCVGSGRPGSFTVMDRVTGLVFNMLIPSVALQNEVGAYPSKFLGSMAKYKFKPPVKRGGKPRFPQYEGLRDAVDMS
jgi:hypothetical protein